MVENIKMFELSCRLRFIFSLSYINDLPLGFFRNLVRLGKILVNIFGSRKKNYYYKKGGLKKTINYIDYFYTCSIFGVLFLAFLKFSCLYFKVARFLAKKNKGLYKILSILSNVLGSGSSETRTQ